MNYKIEIRIKQDRPRFAAILEKKEFVINSNFNPDALADHFMKTISSSSQPIEERVSLSSLPEAPVPPKKYREKKGKKKETDQLICPFMKVMQDAR